MGRPLMLPRFLRPDPEHPSKTFSSLRIRNYRLFFVGQLISVCGTWMQTVAQAWLVLQLTHSGTDLGIVTAARFAPLLFLGPWGGLVADRLDKRRVLCVTQTLAGLLAGALALVAFDHVATIWPIYGLALALGFVNVFDNPARQSFISEMVPNSELRNAVTLNSVTLNLARVIGPAIAGVLIATVGIGPCFAANAVSFGAVVISLVMMRREELWTAPPERRQPGQIRQGLRYVISTPELFIPLLMITIVGTLAWEFAVSLPLLARSTFRGGAGTYGTMLSVMGVGAVVGGLVTARRAKITAVGLAWASIGWGIAILAAALAPRLWLELVVLLFVGYGSISFNSLAKTTLQLGSAPAMRGRVMALWSVAWLGSTPVGGPIVGWVGQHAGARWALVLGGVPTLLCGVVAFPSLRRIDRRTAAHPADPDTAADPGPVAPPPAETTSGLP
ncbi:MAG TPA: MFS transporter [Acidimicrobiales bacterium]|nr:MFS transporter [Acidimicrobiales bacterium]